MENLQIRLSVKDWRIQEETGYKPKTTIYTDFSIAEKFGENGIRDTFNRMFHEWQNDVVKITEFTMALNWKCFEHQNNPKLLELYCELYEQMDGWCCDNLKGDDLHYYYKTTD